MASKNFTSQVKITINGKEIENSFSKIGGEVRKLERELKKLPVGSQEFIEKAAQLKKAKEHFQQVKEEINGLNGQLQKSEGFLGRFFSSVAGGLFLFDAVGKAQSIISSTTEDLLKVSDAITSVQKTSGLASGEVQALWDAFSNFDTRTSKLELMNIAQIGGRLGITDREELQNFTREIDKIYVALGDSFQGGLEEVSTKVGKLKNLFEETKGTDYATALNEIGSALNELGASGTSSESNITEFATRIGQLPNALKPSISATLGLGAALEEAGVDAQIGASGYSRFVSVAANDLAGFAKQMQMTTAQATELFNTKPEEFFLRFAESMQGMSGEESAQMLKGLKLNTLEIQKALGAASGNANRFREMMALSNEAMTEAVSIQNEFNNVNENAAAIWEKTAKTVKEFFTDLVAPKTFDAISQIWGSITGLTAEAGKGIEVFRARLSFLLKTLLVATSALISYKSAVWLSSVTTKAAWQQTLLFNIAVKAKNALLVTGRTLLLTARVAWLAMTFQIGAAKTAMQAFNVATKANPIGAMLAVLVAVGMALAVYSEKLSAVSAQKKAMLDADKEAAVQTAKEKTRLEGLLKTAQDHRKSLKERQQAVDELNRTVPEYNRQLTIESASTEQASKQLERYIEKLKQAAREKYLKTMVDQKAEELAKAEFSSLEEHISWYEQAWNAIISGNSASAVAKNMETALKNRNETIKKADDELKMYQEMLDKQRSKNQSEGVAVSDEAMPVGVGASVSAPATSNSNHTKQAQSELLKAQRDFLKKQQDYEDESLELQEATLDKQLAMVEVKHNRRILQIQQQSQDIELELQEMQSKMQELSGIANDASISGKERADALEALQVYQQTAEQKRELLRQNAQMEIAIEQTKQHELNALREKAQIDQIEKQNQAFQRQTERMKADSELMLSEVRNLDQAKALLEDQGYMGELSRIRTLEEAKKALREQANREVLQATMQHLMEQKKQLEEALSGITGESAEKLSQDLEVLSTKLNQIKASINNSEGEEAGGEGAGGTLQGTEAANVDVLGFSAGQWEQMFQNLDTTEGKLQGLSMGMQALSNAGAMFAEIQNRNNQRELQRFTSYQEKRKQVLENQLNSGAITQEQYYNSVEEMEVQLANKKAEIEEKQFKAEKIGRLFSAIGSTAQAVASALTAGPILGPILAGIVGALGAVQIGIIASQQPPQRASYAQGGFTKGIGYTDETGHEVAGVVHKNEYVVPEWLLKDPTVANVVSWIEERRTRKNAPTTENTFADGGYTTETANTTQNTSENNENQHLQNILNRLNDVLEKMQKEGVEAFLITDAQNGKKMHEAIKKYKQIHEKARI